MIGFRINQTMDGTPEAYIKPGGLTSRPVNTDRRLRNELISQGADKKGNTAFPVCILKK